MIFKKRPKQEILNLNIDDFCEYMEAWDIATFEKWLQPTLHEAEDSFVFPSVEAAKDHFGGITLDEFEQIYFSEWGK